MTFADKLMRLRRQKGWSQEELADKLDVTRQAVSRWEGAQTYPDLPKLLQIGEIFDVSLDYLLKTRSKKHIVFQSSKNIRRAEKNLTVPSSMRICENRFRQRRAGRLQRCFLYLHR